jgi:hypothetical protein
VLKLNSCVSRPKHTQKNEDFIFVHFGTHNNKIHTIYKQASVFVLIFSIFVVLLLLAKQQQKKSSFYIWSQYAMLGPWCVYKSYSWVLYSQCVCKLLSKCINYTQACRYHTREYHIHPHTCQNYSRVCGNHTLRVKSHSACGSLTLYVEINFLRVDITLVRVVITFVRIIVTLIRVKITLCVYKSLLCVLKSHSCVLELHSCLSKSHCV